MRLPTVLLVDDDEAFAKSFIDDAHDQGISVDWAATWDEGVALFRALGHELVVADYNLPGSRLGLRLLSEVRRLRPSSRVVLISGAVPEHLLHQSSPLVDAVFVKRPSLPDDLASELSSASVRAAERTDWSEVATAFRDRRDIPEGDLDAVDAALRRGLP